MRNKDFQTLSTAATATGIERLGIPYPQLTLISSNTTIASRSRCSRSNTRTSAGSGAMMLTFKLLSRWLNRAMFNFLCFLCFTMTIFLIFLCAGLIALAVNGLAHLAGFL